MSIQGRRMVALVVDSSTDYQLEGCEQVAQRVHQRMADLDRPHRGTGGSVTVSVGVAVATADARDDFESVVASADQALYAARAAGRGCTVVAGPEGGVR